MDPQFLSGDPFSFITAIKLNIECKPKILLSTAMMLEPMVRKKIEDYFTGKKYNNKRILGIEGDVVQKIVGGKPRKTINILVEAGQDAQESIEIDLTTPSQINNLLDLLSDPGVNPLLNN